MKREWLGNRRGTKILQGTTHNIADKPSYPKGRGGKREKSIGKNGEMDAVGVGGGSESKRNRGREGGGYGKEKERLRGGRMNWGEKRGGLTRERVVPEDTIESVIERGERGIVREEGRKNV